MWSSRRSVVLIATVSIAEVGVANRGSPAVASPVADAPIRLHAAAGWGVPAIDATAVYMLSRHHELLAIERGSGALRWRRPLGPGAALTEGSVVVVAGNMVVAGDDGVFAFAAAAGTPAWRIAGDGEAGRSPGRFVGSATSDVVWLGSASGVVSAVDASRGGLRWRSRVASERVTVFAPVVDGDLLVASFTDFGVSPREGGVVALDAGSGAIRWVSRFASRAPPLPASAGGPPLAVGDLVFAASSDGTIQVMRRVDGGVRWTLPAVAAGDLMPAHEDFRALALAGPRLLVTSLSGVLTAYDVRAPVERWRFTSPPDGSIAFAVTAAGRQAYVPFASGRLLVISSEDGALRRAVGSVLQRFEWPAVIADGTMFLVAGDGLYVCEVAPA